MKATAFGSQIVRRLGTLVGVAVVALSIGLGGVGGHDAAAWSNPHAATAGAGCAAGPADPPGSATGTLAPRYGGGGGTMASRK
jgi:hypothetical protein